MGPRDARAAGAGFLATSRLRDGAGPLDFVEEVFVAARHREQNIARLLFTDAVRAPRTGLVVRAHAPQQAAARALYARLGFVASRVPPFLVDSSGRSVHITPMAGGSQREEFCIASLGSAWGAATPPARARTELMPAQRFLAEHAPLVEEAQCCHDAAGGDGADVSRIIAAADEVCVAVLDLPG